MIKPWIFELFGSPVRGGDATSSETADHYRWHLDLWRRADRDDRTAAFELYGREVIPRLQRAEIA